MQKRQEALQKFREDLSQPMTDRFYNEDELIDLFDFASDFNDDYLRMEVLLCAARFYPTSEDLLQRKAIFYSQYSDEAREKCLDDNKAAQGMIWNIMRGFELKDSDADTKRAYLHKIIDAADNITDEDIIQLVNLTYSFEQYEWLKENIEWIGEKAVFRSVLLYEVATYADSEDDIDFAIKIMEELTELEPYNPDFWMVLARDYIKNHEMDKALSCLDYTIALNPKNVLPQVMKGRLLYVLNQNEDEVLDIVRQIKKEGIENSESLRMEGSIYAAKGELQKLADAYKDYLTAHPEDLPELLPDLVDVVDNGVEDLLDRIFELKSPNSAEEWMRWAQVLHGRGLDTKAAEVIKAYYRNSPQEKPTLPIFESTLRMGLFDVVLHLLDIYDYVLPKEETTEEEEEIDKVINEEFDDFFLPGETPLENWRIDLVRLMTMIKTGDYSQAKRVAKTLKKEISVQGWMSPDMALQVTGMMSLVKDASNKLKKAQATDLQTSYDPFGYWQKADTGDIDEYNINDMLDDVFSDDVFDE